MTETQESKNARTRRPRAAGALWLAAAALPLAALLGAATLAAPPPAGKAPAPSAVTAADARATVLLFVSPNCPVSNGYAPEVRSLADAYGGRGARVELVYAGAGVTAADAEGHARQFGLSGLPRRLDPDLELAASLGATVTPEAFLLGPDGKVRYSGRIDDRHVERGTPRAAGASSRDLRAALDAVLAGKPVPVAKTRAVGCVIEGAGKAAVAAKSGPVTYSGDVARILNENCVSCHRAGEIGPMPLDGYENARRFAENAALAASGGRMPPWKPAGAHGKFLGERRLAEKDVAALKAWADAGAPLGDAAKVRPAPEFPKGWRLGTPDLVLTMPEEWTVPASGDDVYRCFVLPTGVPEDKEVVAVEYRAGNKAVVHHVLGFVDTSGRAREKDRGDDGPGYNSFGGPGFLPSGELGGWAPGNLPAFLPEGIARPLPGKADVVLQVHYHPTGKEERDRTQVGLYFAKKPAKKKLRTFPFAAGRGSLDIPAGEKAYKVERTFPVPVDVEAISVTPHMHLLGKEFTLTAALPDGTKRELIRIDDWDFNWQDTYQYKEAVRLPKGTKVTLTATFDNSADNPRNPNSPPKRVTWGEGTTDEMCIGFVGYVAADEGAPLLRLMDRLRARGGGVGGRRR